MDKGARQGRDATTVPLFPTVQVYAPAIGTKALACYGVPLGGVAMACAAVYIVIPKGKAVSQGHDSPSGKDAVAELVSTIVWP